VRPVDALFFAPRCQRTKRCRPPRKRHIPRSGTWCRRRGTAVDPRIRAAIIPAAKRRRLAFEASVPARWKMPLWRNW